MANVLETSMNFLQTQDPEIAACIENEFHRQKQNIELIASENIASPAVIAAMGSVLTNKYAEGYPGKRYYGGCDYVDVLENIAMERAKALFGAAYANVQPHSGAQANLEVYAALLQPGDTLMGMDLASGGHLTHGARVNLSGKYYNSISYGVDPQTGRIDYDQVEDLVRRYHPKLLVAGASAYPRAIDFKIFADIAHRSGALLIFDEVITGFRAEYGGAQTRFGITPDLTTLGKIIGGGLPVGAFGGKREYMSRVAPAGDVYQAGTLSGNPLAMAAGIATLSVLKASDYAALEARVEAFAAELETILRGKGVPVTVNRLASMYTVFFSDGPLRNFEDVKNSDTEMYSRFFRAMRERNIFVAPSAFEVAMVSFAHTEEDFAKTLNAVRGIKL